MLWALLRRRGIETHLRIGVSVAPGETHLRIGVSVAPGETRRFHAWVEHNGDVINDAPNIAEHYPPFTGTIEPRDAGF